MKTDLKNLYEQHLIDCIRQQCRLTRDYIDANRNHFASNRHGSGYSDTLKQLTFALSGNRSEEAYVYDLDGNKYIDITMGFGVHLFGHSPAFIKEAIIRQLDNGIALGTIHSNAAETAALLCKMTHNERCAFFNSGTEAIMVALRLARAATGKTRIVIFEGAYHGTHDSLLIMKQHPVTKEAITHTPGISESLVQDTILLPFGKQESIDFIEQHGHQIAAVLTEPVRSRHPEESNPAFLQQLQQVCAVKNICFILDEVVTGFRLCNGGAKSFFGLDPDITVYGKILGGGLPIGVVAGKKLYMDFIDGGTWSFSDNSRPYSSTTFVAGTFCHHPLAMAASKATLEFLSINGDHLQNELTGKTAQLTQTINDFCDRQHIPVSLAHFSSFFRFLLKGKTKLIYQALLKEKVYIWEGRTCFLSAAHRANDLQQLEERIIKSLVEMKSAGFFPATLPPKKNIGEPQGFFQAALEINEGLDAARIAMAFQYVCENITIANNTYLQNEFLLFPGEIPGDAIMIKPAECATDLRLLMGYRNNKTQLLMQFSKNHFDGWSSILFTKFLSHCYSALEKGETLPPNRFTPKDLFEKWVNGGLHRQQHEQFAASVIYRDLPALDKSYSGTLFEHLLSCFAMSLGNREHIIAIPLSGQYISRHINTIGFCTCQAPIAVGITETSSPQELVTEINTQLGKVKKEFRYWYNRTGHPAFPVVFNLDNLPDRFLFAGRKIKWIDLEETTTSHDIVCNVTVEPGVLHVAIKYRTSIPAIAVEKIADRFALLITQPENVLAHSK